MALGEMKSQQESDRRVHLRDTVLYRGRLSFGAQEHSCTVLNISAGGAQVRFESKVQALTVVTLHIDRFGSFHARVCWQQGDRVGLQFLEDAVLVTRRIVAASGA